MAVTLSGRRIFLASPGYLDDIRHRVRQLVAQYNALHGWDAQVAFIVVGYEDLPMGGGRPQDLINPTIRESDYLLLLVADRLGSQTTATPPFRTGVEEELAVAAAAAQDQTTPMCDMLILFQSVEEQTLVNPTSQFRQVQAFRSSIEGSKEIGFHDFKTDDELRLRLWVQLGKWAQPLPTPKSLKSYDRLLTTLRSSAEPAMATPPSADPDEVVTWAESQASEGFVATADSAFALAVTHDKPDHLLRYARFLQGSGQLQRAFELDERVLGLASVVGNSEPEAVGHRTRALANMGLIKRKQGDLRASQRFLAEAVATGRAGGAAEHLGYALDQQGLTAARIGDLGLASQAYEEALDLRRGAQDVTGEAQSLINLARLAQQRGDEALAATHLDRAVGLLEGPETRLLANALASLGRLLSGTNPAKSRGLLERALALNDRLHIPDGVSVASNNLAELCLDEGDTTAALRHARRVMEVSSEAGNLEGQAVAQRLVGRVHLARGEHREAIEALGRSAALAAEQGDPGREAAALLWSARARRLDGDAAGAVADAQAGLVAAADAHDLGIERQLRSELEELQS